MFLRLSAIALLVSVQASLADVTTDINNQLSQYHKDLPPGCQINSPQMKLAFACQPLEHGAANPKLHKVVETDGVNYCFNSLVDVQQSGNRSKITVLKDVGGQLRRFQYSVDSKNLKKDSFGDYVLPLEDLAGQCFAYTEENKQHCSSGVFGFGSTDVPMTIKLKSAGAAGLEQSTIINRDEIGAARRNGSQLSLSKDFNKDEANIMALNYARMRLLDHARESLKAMGNAKPPAVLPYPGAGVSRPSTDAAVNTCQAAIAEFEKSLPNAPPMAEKHKKTMEEYLSQRLGTAGSRKESRDLPRTGRPKTLPYPDSDAQGAKGIRD